MSLVKDAPYIDEIMKVALELKPQSSSSHIYYRLKKLKLRVEFRANKVFT
jgi:hypothetical protein